MLRLDSYLISVSACVAISGESRLTCGAAIPSPSCNHSTHIQYPGRDIDEKFFFN